MRQLTLIIPYYRAPLMLRAQLDVVRQYPDGITVVVVDDGSPEPARDVVEQGDRVDLYRIEDDVAWNREQARNIGGHVCRTDWLIQVDIDHILPVECVAALLELPLDPNHWYRFPRFRVGRADDTRKKDAIADDRKFGKIKPHVDSYLITKKNFMANPYNEQVYSGCLGGGTPFATRMKTIIGEPLLLPESVHLHVYTRDKIKDSSISTLSRNTDEYARRRKLDGDSRPKKILLHPWHKVPL